MGEMIFGAVFVAIIAYFLYRMVRYKGFRGSMFGAEIIRTLGEVEGRKMGPMRLVLRVHALRSQDAPDKNVGLEFVAKSLLGYQMTPIALSNTEAMQLVGLLQRAVEGKSG
jgi:hypothetical protein